MIVTSSSRQHAHQLCIECFHVFEDFWPTSQTKVGSLPKLRAFQNIVDRFDSVLDVLTFGLDGLADSSKRLCCVAVQALSETLDQVWQSFLLQMGQVIDVLF
ncbi:hypothetical protein P4200_08235 [Pseudomonas aeruginosa]|nr:hypothetical protein [Pseudomonas aeruginosa]